MSHGLARRATAGDRGMMAAEVLIAAAVIGIGLLGLTAVIPVASHAVQDGGQLSTAVFLASQRLEQVRSARWQGGATPVDEVGVSAGVDAAPTVGGVASFPDEAPLAPPYGDYTRRVRIADCAGGCDGAASADLRHVVVEVDYRPLTAAGVAAPLHRNGAVLSLYLSRR